MGGQKRYRVNRFRQDLLFRVLGIELTVDSTISIYGSRMPAKY